MNKIILLCFILILPFFILSCDNSTINTKPQTSSSEPEQESETTQEPESTPETTPEFEKNTNQFLIVTNPTEKDFEKSKRPGPGHGQFQSGDSWITIQTNSRSITEETTDEYYDDLDTKISNPFVEHTIPFKQINPSDLDIEISYASTNRAVASERTFEVGDTKTFKNSEILYRNKDGIVRYEGTYCYIWTLNNESEKSALSDEEVKEFACKFDSIYEKQTELCGPKYSGNTTSTQFITPDKKISILLFDISADGDEGNIYGFFNPSDYYKGTRSYDQMEIIYVDSYFAKQESTQEAIFSTLIHEFNHLLNFGTKVITLGTNNMDTWYTEMLSMVTEDFLCEDLELNPLAAVQGILGHFLIGKYLYVFKNWNSTENDNVIYNYGNAYAFGSFLARNYGGAKLIHEIMTNEYINEESVVHAVNKINNTSKTFEDLLQEFACVLINPENTNKDLPSLNIDITDKINDSSNFTYHLSAINLNTLTKDKFFTDNDQKWAEQEITYTVYKNSDSIPSLLNAYGFNIFTFPNSNFASCTVKEGLVYRTYTITE